MTYLFFVNVICEQPPLLNGSSFDLQRFNCTACIYRPKYSFLPCPQKVHYTYTYVFAVCDTELFYSVGIYYSEFKVKKNSGSSAAAAERKSGENRTCCGNQLGMILTYAHYSQLLRGVLMIFERLFSPLISELGIT